MIHITPSFELDGFVVVLCLFIFLLAYFHVFISGIASSEPSQREEKTLFRTEVVSGSREGRIFSKSLLHDQIK